MLRGDANTDKVLIIKTNKRNLQITIIYLEYVSIVHLGPAMSSSGFKWQM